MKQLDWDAMEAKARGMSDAELHAAIRDILSVLPNVRMLERGGWLPNGAKSEGYYCDEASVYRRELAHRAKGETPLAQLIEAGNKMARVLNSRSNRHPSVLAWDEAVQRAEDAHVVPL